MRGEPNRLVKEMSHHKRRWSVGKDLNSRNPPCVAVRLGEAKIASIVEDPLSYVGICE